MKNLSILLAAILFSFAACKPKPTDQQTATEARASFELIQLWESDTVFKTPESVLYSPDQNILYVSNINSGPGEKDGNGFISTMGTAGNIIQPEWVTGLSAPKGMGIYGTDLFVSDIDELVIIDIPEARIKEKIKIEGAGFLNDVAVSADGKVYVSDSNTGKIHVYENGKVTEWITEGLSRPNGLFVEKERILLASSESSDLKILDASTGSFQTVTQDIGHGDGVEYTGYEGYYLVSDWSGEIFLIAPDFSSKSLLNTRDQKINSADIGMNPEDHVVYVPTFFDNRVVAYTLKLEED